MPEATAFFTLHRDLPREGPGAAADVAWAAARAGLAPDALICDAGCGPGGDIAALRAAAPQGRVTGVDITPHFVAAAAARFADDDRVDVVQGDLAALPGRYDLIWCAGALYFVGIAAGLAAWRAALLPGGSVAFSYPCYFTAPPSDAAQALWAGEGEIPDTAAIAAAVAAAGYVMVAQRRLTAAAWEAYYAPLRARIARLRPGADRALARVLDAAVAEEAAWRAAQAETGYLLCVVRPA